MTEPMKKEEWAELAESGLSAKIGNLLMSFGVADDVAKRMDVDFQYTNGTLSVTLHSPRPLATIQSLTERCEELEGALKSVRLDICEAGVVVFRIGQPETTFDYIGSVIGDEVTWEEWEARQALKDKP